MKEIGMELISQKNRIITHVKKKFEIGRDKERDSAKEESSEKCAQSR